MKEHREKVPVGDAKAIDDAIADCKKAIESKDISNMKSAVETLTKASHRMAEAMYKASAGQQAPGAGPTDGEPKTDGDGPSTGSGQGNGKDKKDEKVVDAEFEESKD